MSNSINANQIAAIVAQVLAAMGQTENVPAPEFPATSAKVKGGTTKAAMSVRDTTDSNVIEVVLTDAMVNNRMKLPKRMFGSKELVKIDGHEIPQDVADQGRSLKFYPSIFGNVKVGQKLTFTFDRQTKSARHYDVKIGGKGHSVEVAPKATKGKVKNAPAPVAEVKVAREVDPLAKKIRAAKTFNSLIELTAEIAVDNEAKGIKNANIAESNAFRKTLGQDSREFLPTPQSVAFKAMVKKFNKTMTQGVTALNNEFNLYA